MNKHKKISNKVLVIALISFITVNLLSPTLVNAEENPTISFISNTKEVIEGKSAIITISTENGKCANDISLSVGDDILKRTFLTTDYALFYLPPNLAIGEYTFILVNAGINYDLEGFTVKKYEAPPVPDVTFTPSFRESDYKKAKTLTITAEDGVCSNDMSLSLGGVVCKRTFLSKSYGQFYIPNTLPINDYEMLLTNNKKIINLGIYRIKGPTPVPDLSEFIPTFTECKEGKSAVIKVEAKNTTCMNDMSLAIGDLVLKRTFLTNGYGDFYIPPTIPFGEYPMEIINGNKRYDIGKFNVLEKDPPPDPVFISFDVRSSEQGADQTVNITVSPNNLYAADFGLFLGSENLTIKSIESKNIIITVPSTLPVGIYKLQALNRGKYIPIGDYQVIPPPPDPTIKGIDPASGYEESAHKVKLLADIANVYASDLSVSFDGNPISATINSDRSLEIIIPETATIGGHTITVSNRGKIVYTGSFEVIAIPEPIFMGLDSTSGEEEITHSVKILADPANIYHQDLTVFLNTQAIAFKENADKTLSISVPSTLPARVYEVAVYNRGVRKKVGDFEITPIPDPEYYGLESASGMEGNSHKVKILAKATNNYGKDLAVYFNGIALSGMVAADKSITFDVPATTPTGKFAVEIFSRGKKIPVGDYEVVPIPDPIFTKLSVTSCQAGEEATVKLMANASNIYADDTAIYFNDTKISLTHKGTDYLEFKVPHNLGAATYDIRVFNRNKYIQVAEKFTIKPEPYILNVTTIQNASQIVGKTNNVTVNSSEPIAYGGSSFKVTINDIEVKVTFRGSNYFTVTVPASFPVGEYPIKVSNNLTTKNIGPYKVLPQPPVPDPEFKNFNMETYKRNYPVQVEVKNISYSSDFAVLVKGVSTKVSFKSSTYFTFYTPTGVATGIECPVVVKNRGKSYPIGSIILK